MNNHIPSISCVRVSGDLSSRSPKKSTGWPGLEPVLAGSWTSGREIRTILWIPLSDGVFGMLMDWKFIKRE